MKNFFMILFFCTNIFGLSINDLNDLESNSLKTYDFLKIKIDLLIEKEIIPTHLKHLSLLKDSLEEAKNKNDINIFKNSIRLVKSTL